MTDPYLPTDEEPPRVVRLVLSLRFVISVAVVGMGLGALLLFWEGSVEILRALQSIWSDGEPASVITGVMNATDKFLFGIVLTIFAITVTFSFLVDLAPAWREALPNWVAVSGGVGELKYVFFQVILVYLAVDFVTDIAVSEQHRDWTELVMPAAILLLAAAMRLLVGNHPPAGEH